MYTVIRFLHLVAMAYWAGGVFVYALAITPSLTALGPAERGKFTKAFLQRFGSLTMIAVAVVALSGMFLTNRLMGFSALFNTRFGNIILAKIILVLVMLANGAYISSVLGRKLASFGPPPAAMEPGGSASAGPPPGPPPELVKVQGRMVTMGWVQVILMLAKLFLMSL